MFTLVMKNAKLLRIVFESFASLFYEMNLTFSGRGLEACEIDVYRAALFSLRLPTETFEHYEYTGEDAVVIGVNLKELLGVLKLANQDESFRMWLDEEEATLKIELAGPSSTRVFGLSILDIGGERKQPVLALDFQVTMSSSLFKAAVKTSEAGGDQVTLKASRGENTLTFLSRSYTVDVNHVIPLDNNPEVLEYNWRESEVADEEIKADYAIKYLHAFTSGAKLSESVKLEFGHDKPLRVTFEIAGGGELMFITSPRVEWDDES